MDRSARHGILLFTGAAALFLIVNFRSYGGYFQGDDLATLSWAAHADLRVFFEWLVSPRFHPSNFRPLGSFFYRVLWDFCGLRFAPYVAAIQAIHLCNVVLLYSILKRLDLAVFASVGGALFYLLNAATFEIYWRPMFVFDLLCASFCLLTVLFYMRGNWLLGLVTFWLAYKSKEFAVMLPLALAFYEMMLGMRRWSRLLPYFLIAASFGIQGVLLNPNVDNEYSLRLSWNVLLSGIAYYARAEFFSLYLAAAVVVVALFLRDRRAYFGLALLSALLFPMLLLPGRSNPVYWYGALSGLSVIAAVLAGRARRWVAVICMVAWISAQIVAVRPARRAMLATANENRDYASAIEDLKRKHPEIEVFGFNGGPAGLQAWGIAGSIHMSYGNSVAVSEWNSDEFQQARNKRPAAVIVWNHDRHMLRAEIHE